MFRFPVIPILVLACGIFVLMASPASAADSDICAKGSFVHGPCAQHITAKSHYLRYAQDDAQCPAETPLDCSNGYCCPAGATLYCPQMAPTPCFNPDNLSDEQLASLRDHCEPLLSCH